MENRSIGYADRNESERCPQAAAARHATTIDELGDASLSREEVSLLIEFFRLLDCWDRQEVVQ
jgi:hypothetical protein